MVDIYVNGQYSSERGQAGRLLHIEVAIHMAGLVYSHFGATDHMAGRMVSGIEMPVHTADADGSLFPLITRLTAVCVCCV